MELLFMHKSSCENIRIVLVTGMLTTLGKELIFAFKLKHYKHDEMLLSLTLFLFHPLKSFQNLEKQQAEKEETDQELQSIYFKQHKNKIVSRVLKNNLENTNIYFLSLLGLLKLICYSKQLLGTRVKYENPGSSYQYCRNAV